MKTKRLIILGSGGFISGYLEKILISKNKKYIGIKRKKIDLLNLKNIKKLKKIIRPTDDVFFIAARAPVKNISMFDENLKMIINFCKFFDDSRINRIIYLSSDAVYSDSNKALIESSLTQPNNWHGLMHYAREQIIKNNFSKRKILILRPTLVYGKNDPHNGYGPNKFIRLIKNNEDVYLFGKGEELRDHIHIYDVVKIIYYSIVKNITGEYTLATGSVISFYDIANIIKKTYKSKSKIKFKKRVGKMPHGGYRSFDITKLRNKFKKFNFIKIKDKNKNYLNV